MKWKIFSQNLKKFATMTFLAVFIHLHPWSDFCLRDTKSAWNHS